MALTLYGRHTSYNVQKVLWLLDELNLEYNHIEFGSHPGDTESDEFGQLNPMRKVPVLVDGPNSIWESNTILRYIARQYGGAHWWPNNVYQKSLVERWMDWAQTRFEPAFVGVFWGYYRTPDRLRNMEAVNESLEDCQFCLDRINDQLSNQAFMLGDSLSLADVTNGIFLFRLLGINLNVSVPANVGRWYITLQDLESYQKWGMSDFSALKGRLQY